MIKKIITIKGERCNGCGACAAACPHNAICLQEKEKVALAPTHAGATSRLAQWPCQIKLAPTNAPYLEDAHLLIAADCTAYAYTNFHRDFIRNHITLIGCPKLDEGDYAEKLTDIIKSNSIKSVKLVRMEVGCCAVLENAVKRALQAALKHIPFQVITVSTDGRIIE